MFREKALLVAEKLLPAFDTPTGIPLGIINVETGVMYLLFLTIFVHRHCVCSLWLFLLLAFIFSRKAEIPRGQAKVPVFFQSLVH